VRKAANVTVVIVVVDALMEAVATDIIAVSTQVAVTVAVAVTVTVAVACVSLVAAFQLIPYRREGK
jgi:hypothetical protein